MLIGHVLYVVVVGGLTLVAARGLWLLARRFWARKRARRWARLERQAPPPAAVHGSRPSTREVVARWLPFAMLFGGGSAAVEVHLRATDVWVVSSRDREIVVARKHLFGDAVARYAPRAGDNPTDEAGWVVNESARVVHVEYSAYGPEGATTLPSRYAQPIDIPPGATAAVDFIDDIGPDNPSPASIDSREHLLRAWLTWGHYDAR